MRGRLSLALTAATMLFLLEGLNVMLATLFASTGTIMLTAGDEFGRTQAGNNNAYCQDNATTWIDWERRDLSLEAFVVELSARRSTAPEFFARFPASAEWLRLDGQQLSVADWEHADSTSLILEARGAAFSLALTIDYADRRAHFSFTQKV